MYKRQIADIVKLFLNGEKEFEIYLAKAVLIALSFIIAEPVSYTHLTSLIFIEDLPDISTFAL